MKYGLGENQLHEILDILRKYPEVEEAILFGSRAIGTYKEASDIDIALKGKDVSVILATKIQSDLEDTYLPYFFDIISFPSITNQDLIKHINTKGIPIYRAGWKKCKLGDVVNIIGGGTPKTTIDKYWGGDIPWVSIADIVQNNKYIHGTAKTISKEGLKNSSTRLLDKGDIIISARGTVGAVGVLKSRMAFNQSCYGVSAKKNLLDQEYLYYLLTNLITFFNQYSHGGVFDTITRKTFDSIEIYLPPLHKQKEIASILSCLDDKIDLLHRQNKTLESIAQTLFHQWFIKEADEKIKKKRLGDIIDLKYGKSLTSKVRTNNGYPVIGSSGKIGLHSEFLVKGPGIVIGRKGTIGTVSYVEQDFYPIDTTFYVVKKMPTEQLFFEYYLLKSMKLESLNSDSAVPGLNKKNVLSLDIELPIIDKISMFNDKVSVLFEKRIANKTQILICSELRRALLANFLEYQNSPITGGSYEQ